MYAGARVIKTGIAVTLSMYICQAFNIQPAIFAAAATVLNMQPSLGQSLHNAKEQFLIHFVSVSAALGLGLTMGPHPFSMGLVTVLVIILSNRFKWRGGMTGGIMAAIFILASPADKFLEHALVRSLAIFIGVAIALFVNITIAPPRYRQPLRDKLIELNSLISRSFTESVSTYLNLDSPDQMDLKALTKNINKLFKDANRLYDLYHYELGPLSDNQQTDKEKESQHLRDYITYNRGLWQRTRDILFLAQERQERRKQAGDLPISPEFQEILELLHHAQGVFLYYNNNLQDKILDQPWKDADEPRIWSKLDLILNQWHNKFPSGPYYLQALIEVALITYKIRWAAKESVRLIKYDSEIEETENTSSQTNSFFPQ